MRRKVLFYLAAMAMIVVGCKKREYSDFLDYSSAVDLTDVAEAYDRYISEDDSCSLWDAMECLEKGKQKRVKKEMQVCPADDNNEYFDGDEGMISLPEYKASKHPFLVQAEDFYNACATTWNVWSNYEIWARLYSTGEAEEDELTFIADSIESINTSVIRNDTLRMAAEWYRSGVAKYLRDGSDSWEEENNPYVSKDSITNVINNFVYCPYDNEEAYFILLDSTFNVCTELSRKRIERYNNAGEDERLGVVIKELTSCDTFDEQCSLLLLWADNALSQGEDEWILAVSERLMQSGKYNPMLFRIWLIWRCLRQDCSFGLSRDSFIPNNYFNEYRRICYVSSLKRIDKHPEDAIAMNCAAVLAGRTNLIRLGSYMFGNNASVDKFNFMPKRYENLVGDDEDEEYIEDEDSVITEDDDYTEE